MNVLQYNILFGAKTKNRLPRLSSWLQKQQYDVVGFNEMNDWTEDEFQRKADNWGYPYSCLFEMKSSPFFIGVMAKFPIDPVDRTEADPFHHGLLHVKINGIHFLVTHLTPFESAHRERETAAIAQRMRGISDPAVVMGDFNTLSPVDDAHYQQTDVVKRLTSNVRDGEINYKPMQHLLDAGLWDAGLWDVGYRPTFDYSFPTSLEHDLTRAIRRRIDYFLVNDALRKRNPVSEVVYDPAVEKLSDHYPVQCRWD